MVRFEAVYENGVLRPLEPVALPEGAQVELTITELDAVASLSPGQRAHLLAARIAAASDTSSDGAGEETGSIDHDKILYGEHGAR